MVVFVPTRRFFSSSISAVSHNTKESAQKELLYSVEPTDVSPTQDESCPSIETGDCDGPDVPSVETPSPPPLPSSIFPRSASEGFRLFNWSGSCSSSERTKTPKSTSGLSSLQQFQYKKETFSSSPKTHRPSEDTSPLHPSSSDQDPGDNLPDSPPSQDSAYFSQSQSYLTSVDKEEVTNYSFPSYQEDAALVCSYKSLLSLYISIDPVVGLMRGCAKSYFGSMALCSHLCLLRASSGNEFKQRCRVRQESHTINKSREETWDADLKGGFVAKLLQYIHFESDFWFNRSLNSFLTLNIFSLFTVIVSGLGGGNCNYS